MSKIVTFVQVHGQTAIVEAELSATPTFGQLQDALDALGIKIDSETFIFLDEAEAHLCGERHDPVHGIKHGCRIHISRCKRIKTTVHYLEKTTERDFPPGTRVRAVKEWAVGHFHLNPKDAAEHVLQLCKSTERPSGDMPLQQLVRARGHHDDDRQHMCALCFDLVPDKRVEG